MTQSLQKIDPVVVLPQPDGGRIEITVVDGTIWLSDYSQDKGRDVSNFTLCIARGPIEGNADAVASVHQLYKQRGSSSNAQRYSGRGRTDAQQKLLARVGPKLAEQPPSKAGYWFVDPTIAPHGGPVVVVDP